MPTNPRQRAALRLAPSAGELPDTRAAVARALLDRYFPVDNVIRDNATHILRGDSAAQDELENDPRYLIGRLQQCLTALLQQEMPPLDATMTLLAEAIEDAIDYRERRCVKCPDEQPCGECMESYHQAGLYEGLWRELGTIADFPPLPAQLTAVSR
jgi:hypothetical protein